MRHLCAVVTCAVPSHAQAAPAESDPVWDWRRRADDADVFKEVSVNELAEQLLTVCRSPRGRSTAPPWTALLWTVCSRIAPPCVSAALRPPAALRPCTDEPGAAVWSIGTALAQRPSCSVVCRSFMHAEADDVLGAEALQVQGRDYATRRGGLETAAHHWHRQGQDRAAGPIRAGSMWSGCCGRRRSAALMRM